MANAVDFRGMERKEQVNFITESGKYRLMIKAHEFDGWSNEGNEVSKYTFEAKKVIKKDDKPALSDETYQISQSYNVDEKQAWVFMNLADAMKIDYSFNPEDLVGRYVIVDIEMKSGKTDPDKKFANINPYSYRYSVANDGLPPVPEFKGEEEQKEPEQGTLDIDEDDVPF